MKAAWFHCYSGVAGDMALGALVDAGADIKPIRESLKALAVGQWTLDAEITERAHIRSTRIVIEGAEDDTVSRTFTTIRSLLNQADLPARVKERSLAVFTRIAEAEAFVHSTEPEHVHFHEVGGIDSILDIVGTCLALEQLGIDAVYCSPIATGYGTVESAHGTLPVPAPAVIKLLEGAPLLNVERHLELTTPTGAALMTTFAESFGAMPAFSKVISSGFGAGTKEFDTIANCTQVVIGELSEFPNFEQAVVIETNVDDCTGEVLANAITQLLTSGAHDAWVTPIVMKKGRPAHTISALGDLSQASELTNVLMRETGSFGVRLHTVSKVASPRLFDKVRIHGEDIAIKVGDHRAKAEFDDAARVAEKVGVPVAAIIAEAEALWRSGRSAGN